MQHPTYDSPLARMYRGELERAIASRAMVALVGPPGAGKTFLLRQVMQSMPETIFARALDLTDRALRIGSLLQSLVIGLSATMGANETPRRSMAALSYQALRLLGEAVVRSGRQVCLVVDDAQRLHPSTMTALKMLRERDFAGHAPLLAVVLVGWPELGAMIERRRDVAWRCETLSLAESEGWFTAPERLAYTEAVYGERVEEGARLAVASQTSVPAEIDALVTAALRRARLAGFERVDERTLVVDARQALGRLGIKYPELAREMGVGVSTAHRAVNDGPSNAHHERARQAISSIAERIARERRAS